MQNNSEIALAGYDMMTLNVIIYNDLRRSLECQAA